MKPQMDNGGLFIRSVNKRMGKESAVREAMGSGEKEG